MRGHKPPPKALSAQLGTVSAGATVMGEGQSKERAILGWKLSGSLMSPLPGPSPMRGILFQSQGKAQRKKRGACGLKECIIKYHSKKKQRKGNASESRNALNIFSTFSKIYENLI